MTSTSRACEAVASTNGRDAFSAFSGPMVVMMSRLLVSMEGVFEVDDKRETQGNAEAGDYLQ